MIPSASSEASRRLHQEVWTLTRRDDFELARFDDGVVLHDDLGASILLLSTVAGDALHLLMSCPSGLGLEELARRLLGDEELLPDDTDALTALLVGLQAQGLVERQVL